MNVSSSSRIMVWKTAGAVLRLIWGNDRMLLLGAGMLQVVAAIIPALQIYTTKEMVDVLSEALVSPNKTASFPAALAWVTLQSFLFASLTVMRSIGEYMSLQLQTRTSFHMDKQIAEKAAKLPLSVFDQPTYYDQLQRVSNGVSLRTMNVIQSLFALVQHVFTLTAVLIVLAAFHWAVAAALLLILIPNMLLHMRIGQWQFWQMIAQTPTARRSKYIFQLLCGREAAKEIRVFGTAIYLRDLWSKLFWKNATEQLRLHRKTLLSRSVHEGGAELTLYLACILLTWLCVQGRMTVGSFVSIFQAMRNSQNAMSGMVFTLSRFYQDALYVSEWFTFAGMEEERSPEKPSTLSGSLQKGIEVRELTFQYPGAVEPDLDQISLHIHPGQKIAIVGENGAGKSTLIKCLIGLYSPSQGQILYDGIPLESLEPTDFRKRVTAVFQDFVQYQLTLKENIGLGHLEQINNTEALIQAAHRTGINEWLTLKAESLETQLGILFEGGKELSLGQWQKVALSRALFKEAELVVLDEPTSSMDPKAEAELYRLFSTLSEGKISLMVSHRLGSCKHADLILVMEKGRIIEQGNHNQLMSQNGVYADMFRIQANLYHIETVSEPIIS
ncbi:ABC transporter ATP-binding protein [Paenibacillus psychroresistens]|uniref:ABC transporter ATP-binding protein n=1 Tax=Paenibacillus psychroresistens TaxID=1778678 RepID=UPI001390A162|nr:ABC transporter ATP-binding protein [Paenibacillus psychroresistens]